MGAATRRQGHGTAAEVVASVVTLPTAVGDVAKLKTCSLLVCQSRAPHFFTAVFVCVLCPVLSILSKGFFGTQPDGREIFSDAKARKLCSSNKENLAQPDEAWIKTSSLRCYLVPRHSSVFAMSTLVFFYV